MAELMPPMIIEIMASIKDFQAKKDEVIGGMEEIQKAGKTTSERMAVMGSRIATGYLMAIAGATAYSIKLAYEYNEVIDKIGLESGASAEEVDRLKGKILEVSSATATSNKEIADAYLQAEKAGLRKSAADDLVTASAKAAKVTGGTVVDMTKAVIAAQTLQITKGMSVAELTDTLVNANKAHIGSISSLETALQGRVGAAFAAHNLGLQESLVITDKLSQAGFANTRAMMTFASSLSKAQAPTSAQVKSMEALGVNSSKVATMLSKPNGVIQTVQYLGEISKKTGESAGKLATAVFGASGSSAGSVLIKNATALAAQYSTLAGSGADLNKQFDVWLKTPAGQMSQFKTSLQNIMTDAGSALLPAATQILKWANGFVKLLNDHPVLKDIFSGAAIGTAVLAASSKFGNLIKSVKGLVPGLNKVVPTPPNPNDLEQTALLEKIALSTSAAAVAGETSAAEGSVIAGELGVADTALVSADTELALIATEIPASASGGLLTKVLPAVGGLLARFGPAVAGLSEAVGIGGAIAASDAIQPAQQTKDIKNFAQVVPTLVSEGWKKSDAEAAAAKFKTNFKDAFIDNWGSLQGFAGTYGAHATYKEYAYKNYSAANPQIGQVVNGKVIVTIH